LRGCFITGTDTGVGKTVVAAAIVAALRARGIDVRALKPVITGLDEPAEPGWPHDHELLAAVAGCSPEQVALKTYGPAVSPHLAAEMAGRPLDLEALIRGLQVSDGEVLIVEGVGGLMVPLGDGYDVRELARRLALPLVIVARPGLGTLNHTLLTLEAARSAGLSPVGVVLTPWPRTPTRLERSNLETIAAAGGVRVATIARIERPDRELLSIAGEALPLDDWLG
jgi:dethiobiotin synthetase